MKKTVFLLLAIQILSPLSLYSMMAREGFLAKNDRTFEEARGYIQLRELRDVLDEMKHGMGQESSVQDVPVVKKKPIVRSNNTFHENGKRILQAHGMWSEKPEDLPKGPNNIKVKFEEGTLLKKIFAQQKKEKMEEQKKALLAQKIKQAPIENKPLIMQWGKDFALLLAERNKKNLN